MFNVALCLLRKTQKWVPAFITTCSNGPGFNELTKARSRVHRCMHVTNDLLLRIGTSPVPEEQKPVMYYNGLRWSLTLASLAAGNGNALRAFRP